MRHAEVRPSHLLTFVMWIIMADPAVTAQTPAKGPVVVSFTATTDNVSGAGENVKINLFSWSSDGDRDQLLAAWNLTTTAGGTRGSGGRAGGRGGAAPVLDPADPDNPPAGRGGRGGRGAGNAPPAASPPPTPEASLTEALRKTSTLGILWTSETTGYSIHYAYRLPQPDGGERVILATDRRLGAWNSLWKPSASAVATDYAFTVIELRLNSKGEGEGKASLTGKVFADSAASTIALDGYATLPVVFKGVKRQSGN